MRSQKHICLITKINPPTTEPEAKVVELQWVHPASVEAWVEADMITEVTDLADVYIETYRQGILQENQLHLQRQREHAEQRRLQGLSAICECCGNWIPEERLNVVPYATRCVHCQYLFEKRHPS